MNTIEMICPICSRQYKADSTRLKFGRQTTCSRKCSYEARAEKLIKDKIASFCGNCGAKVIRRIGESKNKHGHVFCSARCQYAARSKGITPSIRTKYNIINPISQERRREIGKQAWQTRVKNGTDRHTETTKRKLSEITSNNIASGKINRISKIEYIVADKLILNNIKFVHQYTIRDKIGRYCACIDFFLPEFNIAIEVNGTFWHADPRIYDQTTLKSSQIRTLLHYSKKLTILDSLSIDLFEIWEIEIKSFPNECLNSVLEFIRNI